jgi:hypothetical protein
MARLVSGPVAAAEMERFLETFMYHDDAFLVDEIVRMDAERRSIDAVLDTTRSLPFADRQRVSASHPAHVSGPELIMVTASLGCLHAWFFHGCRWDEGWVGFGNRIHRAEFRKLGRRGPPLRLESREIRSRRASRRVVIRYEFRFRQNDELVYASEQSAMFVRGPQGPDAPVGEGG